MLQNIIFSLAAFPFVYLLPLFGFYYFGFLGILAGLFLFLILGVGAVYCFGRHIPYDKK